MTIGDEITIDEAIEELQRYINWSKLDEYPYIGKRKVKAISMGIKALEQTKWIPVNEDLPKDNGWYQCTIVSDNLLLTMDLFYKDGKWLDNRRIDIFNTYDIYGYGNSTEKHKLSYQELISELDWTANVIAWMSLPKPYKSESEE